MGCHFLLQRIFPTQGLNSDLLHLKQNLYLLSYQGSPHIYRYQLFIFFKLIYLVIFWLCWGFVATHRLSLVMVSRGSSLVAVAFCCGTHVLGRVGLRSCSLKALECRLSSCGTWPYLLLSTWNLPRPGIELMSPALAGRLLPTTLPGKSSFIIINVLIKHHLALDKLQPKLQSVRVMPKSRIFQTWLQMPFLNRTSLNGAPLRKYCLEERPLCLNKIEFWKYYL